VQAVRRIAMTALTIAFSLLLFFQSAIADFSRAVYGKDIVHYEHHESLPEKYSQNPEKELE